jgi:lipopolysaccharide biosynthesis regulator YciM
MAKASAKTPVKPGIEISNVHIQNTVTAEANDHTRAAVEALANAVAANAEAITAIAQILKPAPAQLGPGIHLQEVGNG